MDDGKSESVGPSGEHGFTFIEVIISLMLLAAAASILIGLEGAAVHRTIRDRNVQQSMLAARRILSVIEANPNTINIPQQTDVPVLEVLRTIGAPETTDEREARILTQLRATIKLEDWSIPVPNIEQNALKRLDLVIAWGSEPDEHFFVTYFIPAPEEDDLQ